MEQVLPGENHSLNSVLPAEAGLSHMCLGYRKAREDSARFSFLVFEHILRCSQNCFLPDPSAIGGKEAAKSSVPSPSTVRISTLIPQGPGQQAPLQALFIAVSTVEFSFWT